MMLGKKDSIRKFLKECVSNEMLMINSIYVLIFLLLGTIYLISYNFETSILLLKTIPCFIIAIGKSINCKIIYSNKTVDFQRSFKRVLKNPDLYVAMAFICLGLAPYFTGDVLNIMNILFGSVIWFIVAIIHIITLVTPKS